MYFNAFIRKLRTKNWIQEIPTVEWMMPCLKVPLLVGWSFSFPSPSLPSYQSPHFPSFPPLLLFPPPPFPRLPTPFSPPPLLPCLGSFKKKKIIGPSPSLCPASSFNLPSRLHLPSPPPTLLCSLLPILHQSLPACPLSELQTCVSSIFLALVCYLLNLGYMVWKTSI